MIRVEVVRAACRGYANCLEVAPDVFALDADDVAVVRIAEHADSERERLQRAAARCPARAILLHDADGG